VSSVKVPVRWPKRRLLAIIGVSIGIAAALALVLIAIGGSGANPDLTRAFSRGDPYGLSHPLTLSADERVGDLGYISPVSVHNYLKVPVKLESITPEGIKGPVRFEGVYQLSGCTARSPTFFDQYTPGYGWIIPYRLRAPQPVWATGHLWYMPQCHGHWYWIDKIAFYKPGLVTIAGFEAVYQVDGTTYRDTLSGLAFKLRVHPRPAHPVFPRR
jgi:hypothetical protein